MPRLRAVASGGAFGGTPGLATTSDALPMRARSCPPSCTSTPSSRSAAAVDSSDGDRSRSEAYTSAPLRASSAATERPLRASPTTAISPFSHPAGIAGSDTRLGRFDVTVIARLPQLDGGEREEGAEDADDPEADHHLCLVPALDLEVMVDGRALEDPMRLGVV